MTPIEIFALILAVVAAIKIMVIFIQPKSWLGLVKAVYKTPTLTMIVSLVLAAIVLYYLVWVEGITIIQIFAVMLFVGLLAAITMSSYFKEVTGVAEKMLRDKSILKKAWLSIIVWIVLIVWALYTLFI